MSDLECPTLICPAGYQTRPEAEARLVQSLTGLIADWPRETFSGFMVHFTNRNLEVLRFSLSLTSYISKNLQFSSQ